MTATAEVQHVLNGVDVDRLVATIDAIKVQPELAEFQFRAENEWLGGGHNRTTIQGFYGAGAEDGSRSSAFVLDADEPDVLLGQNQGANPVEHLLNALAACMTTSMVYHAAARGISIERVESHLEGDLDLRGFLGLSEDVNPGYGAIRAHFKVKSNADAEELKSLFKYSPVCDTVCRPVRVEQHVEVTK